MSRPDRQLDRFLRALHRRLVMIRIAEHAGIGMLIGAVMSAVFVCVMLYRGDNAWAVAATVTSIGTLAGAFWGMVHRPTHLAAAAEADRQLRTEDLLATAWSIEANANADDLWARSVMAVASARCGEMNPSSVLLHRFGLRAWAGIFLAVGFVGTLAAMSSRPVRAGTEIGLTNEAAETSSKRSSRPIVKIAEDRRTNQRRTEQSPVSERALDREDGTASSSIAPPSDRRESASLGSTPGAGAGQATSPRQIQAKHDRSESTRLTPPADSEQSAGGDGDAARRPAGGEIPALGTVRNPPTATAVVDRDPNFRRPTLVESALKDVEAGRVPDDVKELVREYFDPALSLQSNRVSERP